jgi:hypothetical protein
LDAIIIHKALDESRIEVFTLRNRRLVAKLQTDFSLGKGEAEAIALALDEKAQIGLCGQGRVSSSKPPASDANDSRRHDGLGVERFV